MSVWFPPYGNRFVQLDESAENGELYLTWPKDIWSIKFQTNRGPVALWVWVRNFYSDVVNLNLTGILIFLLMDCSIQIRKEFWQKIPFSILKTWKNQQQQIMSRHIVETVNINCFAFAVIAFLSVWTDLTCCRLCFRRLDLWWGWDVAPGGETVRIHRMCRLLLYGTSRITLKPQVAWQLSKRSWFETHCKLHENYIGNSEVFEL